MDIKEYLKENLKIEISKSGKFALKSYFIDLVLEGEVISSCDLDPIIEHLEYEIDSVRAITDDIFNELNLIENEIEKSKG